MLDCGMRPYASTQSTSVASQRGCWGVGKPLTRRRSLLVPGHLHRIAEGVSGIVGVWWGGLRPRRRVRSDGLVRSTLLS